MVMKTNVANHDKLGPVVLIHAGHDCIVTPLCLRLIGCRRKTKVSERHISNAVAMDLTTKDRAG